LRNTDLNVQRRKKRFENVIGLDWSSLSDQNYSSWLGRIPLARFWAYHSSIYSGPTMSHRTSYLVSCIHFPISSFLYLQFVRFGCCCCWCCWCGGYFPKSLLRFWVLSKLYILQSYFYKFIFLPYLNFTCVEYSYILFIKIGNKIKKRITRD